MTNPISLIGQARANRIPVAPQLPEPTPFVAHFEPVAPSLPADLDRVHCYTNGFPRVSPAWVKRQPYPHHLRMPLLMFAQQYAQLDSKREEKEAELILVPEVESMTTDALSTIAPVIEPTIPVHDDTPVPALASRLLFSRVGRERGVTRPHIVHTSSPSGEPLDLFKTPISFCAHNLIAQESNLPSNSPQFTTTTGRSRAYIHELACVQYASNRESNLSQLEGFVRLLRLTHCRNIELEEAENNYLAWENAKILDKEAENDAKLIYEQTGRLLPVYAKTFPPSSLKEMCR